MKTVTKIIDEVREEMCMHYCKYSEKANELLDGDQEKLEELCGECPLNRL